MVGINGYEKFKYRESLKATQKYIDDDKFWEIKNYQDFNNKKPLDNKILNDSNPAKINL
jgi:hypothetical protein